MWSMGGSGDPRLDKYNQPVTGGLNRWIVKHSILTPVIGFAVTAVLFAVSYFTGKVMLSRFAILPLIVSILLLIYGLIRKAIYVAERRKVEPKREEPDLSGPFKKT